MSYLRVTRIGGDVWSRRDHAVDGAWALGLLGCALSGPAALESAGLDLEAYWEQLDDDWDFSINDALVIVRGRPL